MKLASGAGADTNCKQNEEPNVKQTFRYLFVHTHPDKVQKEIPSLIPTANELMKAHTSLRQKYAEENADRMTWLHQHPTGKKAGPIRKVRRRSRKLVGRADQRRRRQDPR